jgi:hypothetical protein
LNKFWGMHKDKKLANTDSNSVYDKIEPQIAQIKLIYVDFYQFKLKSKKKSLKISIISSSILSYTELLKY